MFCTLFNIGDPFPVTEQLLCSYAAYLADAGLAPQSIKSYLAAIRDMQISIGLPDPREQSSLPVLRRVQAGISRVRASAGQPKRVRLPITPQLLRQIKAALDPSFRSRQSRLVGRVLHSLFRVLPPGGVAAGRWVDI